MVEMMLPGMDNQRRADLSWQALKQIDLNKKRSVKELWTLCAAVGYSLNAKASWNSRMTTASELLQAGLLQTNNDFDISTLAVPARCEHCDCIIDLPDPPECICSTNYCSVACFRKDMPNHKTQCQAIIENTELACMLTQTYWNAVVRGDCCYPFWVALAAEATSGQAPHVKPYRDFVAEWREHCREHERMHRPPMDKDAELLIKVLGESERLFKALEMMAKEERKEQKKKEALPRQQRHTDASDEPPPLRPSDDGDDGLGLGTHDCSSMPVKRRRNKKQNKKSSRDDLQRHTDPSDEPPPLRSSDDDDDEPPPLVVVRDDLQRHTDPSDEPPPLRPSDDGDDEPPPLAVI